MQFFIFAAMNLSAENAFQEIDELSQQKVPFVCVIDFLKENCEVFKVNELLENKVQISFPTFSNAETAQQSAPDLHLETYPISRNTYEKGFNLVKKNLQAGNSYLINYTCSTEIAINLSLEEIFQHSKAKYKVLFKDVFTCFSPETFIEIRNNRIFTHPMKGTIDAAIPDAVNVLRNNKKEKAEHYTVVDLLRNDLSMVADEVRLDQFQRIDFIKTAQKNLYAMSSEISGDLKPEFQSKIGRVLQKLLPAGSILGAPKKKTLEVILEAETQDRGFYTGVCGYFDGENFDSCVMIRFIEKKDGKIFFKSGGGITHLSNLEDEYTEMKNKIYVPVH